MEQKTKKINIKIIVSVVIVIIVIAIIINCIKSYQIEQIATTYISTYFKNNSYIKKNNVNINNIWVYEANNKYFIIFDYTYTYIPNYATDNKEIVDNTTIGNLEGLTIKEFEEFEELCAILKGTTDENKYFRKPKDEQIEKAQIKGKKINVKKIENIIKE